MRLPFRCVSLQRLRGGRVIFRRRRPALAEPGGAEDRALPRSALPGRLFPVGSIVPAVDLPGALALPDVLACCRLLAETASTLPLVPYRRSDGGRVRVTGGRLVDLLARPAPAVSQ